MIDPELLQLLATIASGAGAAFVGGKNSLNGFKTEMRTSLSSMDARVAAVHEDLMEVKGDVKELRTKDAWHDARLQDLEAARRVVPLDITSGDA